MTHQRLHSYIKAWWHTSGLYMKQKPLSSSLFFVMQSWIESSLLGDGSREPGRLGWRCVYMFVCECVWNLLCVRSVLIKHQQLLGPGGGKTSQPLNQDNAFCVTGAGIRCPASPPSPCMSSLPSPSHLLTLRQSHSCHAAYCSKNKWWLPKSMVKAGRLAGLPSLWHDPYWWIVVTTTHYYLDNNNTP